MQSVRRHLVVEGMDGSGKDTLIRSLLTYRAQTEDSGPHFTLHERASTSLGGPVTNLDMWVVNDLSRMVTGDLPPSLYNRHPLISELIYADRRLVNVGLKFPFTDPSWVEKHRKMLAYHSVLVVCDPGWRTVKRNLDRSVGGHMPGVAESAEQLYSEYQEVIYRWAGPVIRYNYTTTPSHRLVARIRNLMEWSHA